VAAAGWPASPDSGVEVGAAEAGGVDWAEGAAGATTWSPGRAARMRRPPEVEFTLNVDEPSPTTDRQYPRPPSNRWSTSEEIDPEIARSSAVTPVSGVSSTPPEIDSAR